MDVFDKIDRVELGRILAKLREANGISRYSIYKKGLQYRQINTIERGDSSYTIDLLLKYIEYAEIKTVFFKKEELLILNTPPTHD
jgi:transcriptional regulator with XRE-family HTH domain